MILHAVTFNYYARAYSNQSQYKIVKKNINST